MNGKLISLNIREKGLIVVAFPLFFQLMFSATFTILLLEAKAELDRESQSRQMLARANQVVHLSAKAMAVAAAYRINHQLRLKERYATLTQDIESEFSELKSLARSNPQQLSAISSMESGISEAHAVIVSSLDASSLTEVLQKNAAIGAAMNCAGAASKALTRQIEQSTIESGERRRSLSSTIRVAMISGIFLDLCLALLVIRLFISQIADRLAIVRKNIRSLAQRTALAPVLAGKDEIAQLDLAVHEAARTLFQLEDSKRRTLVVIRSALEQPLAALRYFIEKIEQNYSGDKTEKLIHRLQLALSNVCRCERLVRTLMDSEQIKDGRLSLEVRKIEAAHLVTSAVQCVSELSARANITVKQLVEASELEGDEDRLTEVLVNFLTNAIKYSRSGSTVEVVGTIVENNHYQIDVIDYGAGLPETIRTCLFKPFSQDAESKTSSEGYGLGLAISKTIIEAHRGSLGADSERDRGSRFWLRLPLNENFLQASEAGNNIVGKDASAPRLLSKALLVIALPLVSTLILIITLGGLLAHSDKYVEQEAHAYEVIARVSILTRSAANMGRLVTAELIKGSRDMSRGRKEVIIRRDSAMADLLSLVAGRSEEASIADQLQLMIRESDHIAKSGRQEITSTDLDEIVAAFVGKGSKEWIYRFNGLAQELIEIENRILEQSSESLRKSIADIRIAFIAGSSISVAFSILASIYFSQSIVGRIGSLRENARRLSVKSELVAPVKGNDEIADLDVAFHATASKLAELETFKKHILGVISHEIKTPLNSVQTVFYLLRKGAFGQLDETLLALVNEAEAENDKLIGITIGLLDLEKLDAKPAALGPVQYEPGDFAQIIASGAESLKHVWPGGECDETIMLLADGSRLEMAIVALRKSVSELSDSTATWSLATTTSSCLLDVHYSGHAPVLLGSIADNTDLSSIGSSIQFAIAERIAAQHSGTILVVAPEDGQVHLSLQLPLTSASRND